MATKPNQRGRNAGTGEFTTIKEARAKPNTHIVETIKTPKPAPPKKK